MVGGTWNVVVVVMDVYDQLDRMENKLFIKSVVTGIWKKKASAQDQTKMTELDGTCTVTIVFAVSNNRREDTTEKRTRTTTLYICSQLQNGVGGYGAYIELMRPAEDCLLWSHHSISGANQFLD